VKNMSFKFSGVIIQQKRYHAFDVSNAVCAGALSLGVK
jgi:hypothetical protein